MASIPLTFFFLALVILLGFITARIFQATRFPDIPILLSLGLLLGPLNEYALSRGFGSSDIANNVHLPTLKEFAPFVSTLALVIILFDSGLKLDFRKFSKSMRPAFLHTLPTFALTVVVISLVAVYVFGMPVLVGVVLAVALSNVGQTVSAAIIREIDLDPEVRSIYFIEMALYDLVSIPILVSILQFAQETAVASVAASAFAQSLARVISISIILGVSGGMIWIYVVRQMQTFPHHYMVTLAGLLMVYSLNSFLGGSGPVSVLIFGLVIGNRSGLLKFLKMGDVSPIGGDKVHSFHDEITFFVRAFFFIFLGLTFSTGAGGKWTVSTGIPQLARYDGTATLFLAGVALIFFAILVSRWLVVRFVSSRGAPERRGLYAVYGRGLGTAVLATFPFTVAQYKPGEPNAYTDLFLPWEQTFLNTALLIILLTVTGTSLTVYTMERKRIKQEATKAVSGDAKSAAKE